MNRLESIFRENKGNPIYKWIHYFDIYERYFSKYVGKEVVILEIGVFRGGSLKMWKEYFGERATIYGIDIDPDCKQFEDENIHIFIGSQEDRDFLKHVRSSIPKLDILIDDGGHTMRQQITTFEEMFDHVKDDGVYLCEDTHTSYWKKFGGGLRRRGSFIEYAKGLVDSLTGWHYDSVDKYTSSIRSISFFDSVVVFEKAQVPVPEVLQTGIDSVRSEASKKDQRSEPRRKLKALWKSMGFK